MRKFHVLGAVLLAVCAFGALLASSAFAVTQWLLNGNTLAAPIPVLSVGEELFADMKGGLFGEEIDILCSFEELGTVGPGAEDLISSIFPLGGKDEGIEPMLCETMTGICPKPELTLANFNIMTLLILVGSEFRDEFGPGLSEAGEEEGPGYTTHCEGVTDTCRSPLGGLPTTKITNPAENDVVSEFEVLSEEKPGTCVRGGAGQALVNGSDLTFSDEGVLSVSDV
jgi:hypothetical protein